MNFLNNLDLNLNELRNAILHPLSSDPTGQLAQLIYNTTSDTVRVYDGSQWKDVGGLSSLEWGDGSSTTTITDGETIQVVNGTFVSTSLSGNDITVDLSASGTPSSSTYLRGDNTWASLPASDNYTSWTARADSGTDQAVTSGNILDIAGGTGITTSISTSGGDPDTITITHDDNGTAGTYTYPTSITTNAQGHITSITAGASPGTMDTFDISDGTNTAEIGDSETIQFQAGTGLDILVTSGSPNTLLYSLDLSELTATTTWTKAADYLVVVDGGANRKMLSTDLHPNDLGYLTADWQLAATAAYKITNLKDPTANQDAATKLYVDTVLAGSGALIYQGGYDAATNTPDLDTSPSGGIKKGWTYTVTADGTFFTEQVRVGDLLIAESDAPTALTDWTVVQANTDLASTTTVGLASFSSDNFAVSASGQVTVKDNGIILGTETTGNYVATITGGTGIDSSGATSGEGIGHTLSLDLNELSEETTAANIAYVAIVDTSGNSEKAAVSTLSEAIQDETTYKASIGDGSTLAYAVTHNLNTRDVIVSIFDNTTYETVYADIDRNTVNQVTITFGTGNAPALNNVRVLIQAI